MTDTSALSTCPFCGERAQTYFIPERHSYQIECSDVFGCTARVTQDSEQAAIEAWNLRAPAPASQPVAAPAQAGKYPELPVPLVLESGYGPGDVPDAYTASQMRAYVDADRAARKPLALVAFFMEKL